ncbi:hypothetical protein PVAND_015161 [Polypedilum vanderplanki]|uniref:C2H2-type domain-containing protein n=1 Tax=Polypedilum vanderplanki TaxID=319348 RepID=A0A9J6BBF6_POLVA|nr:hypothetical protein PVAND_015161 [Polypedilum vanderplanki]
MSKPNVVIKGISLYDIDLDSDLSCDEEIDKNELSTIENFQTKFTIKTEENFIPQLEIVNEVANSNEILTDIKTEEAIELTSGNFDENFVDFRANIDDDSEIVRQSWLDLDEDENLGEIERNLESSINGNFLDQEGKIDANSSENRGIKIEENSSICQGNATEKTSSNGVKKLNENLTIIKVKDVPIGLENTRKRPLNFARKSTSLIKNSFGNLQEKTKSLGNLQIKSQNLGILVKTSPNNSKVHEHESSDFDENLEIKEEILDFEDNQKLPIRITKINGEPPRKIAKFNFNEIKKFKIIKPSEGSNLKMPNFIKILPRQENGNSIISQEIKQEPEENIVSEHNENNYFTDEDDSESDENEKLGMENHEEVQSSSSTTNNNTKTQKSLSQMFQNTLKNQGETVRKERKWIKFKNAGPETIPISQSVNEANAVTIPPIRVPKTITISKVSSAKKSSFKKPEFKIENFKCNVCHKFFSSFADRLQHLKEVHNHVPELMRFRCIKCNASFTAKEDLLAHVDTHEKSFKCSICEQEFSHNFRLQEHLLLHKDTNAFTCKICDKKFSRNDVLNQHIRLYHSKSSKNFKCDVCNYETLVKQNFEKHVGMHLRMAEKLKNNKFFYCKHCPQLSFRDETVLKAHVDFMHQ